MTNNRQLESLTDRQEEVFCFIAKFRSAHDYSPSIQEISNYFDVNPNAISDHLKVLKKKGYIKIIPKISRGILING